MSSIATQIFSFTSKSITISFHIPSCILNIADRRNNLKTKNSNKRVLLNLEPKTKFFYLNLQMAIQNSIY